MPIAHLGLEPSIKLIISKLWYGVLGGGAAEFLMETFE